jgi:hypothetical protein
MRLRDVLSAMDVLAARSDVDPQRIYGSAGGAAGVWLLIASALDPRVAKIWIDTTPYAFRPAMEKPLHRDLHDALFPGILLRWDLPDVVNLAGARRILWTDPTDWMSSAFPAAGAFRYRTFEQPDSVFVNELLAR